MTPPIVKRLLICACALLITWAVSSSSVAGQFYYSAGYGPTPYYAGYGPTSYYAAYGPRPYYVGYAPRYYGYRAYRGYPYRAYYRVGYSGYSPWSASYASYNVANYCGSGCGITCNPCGGGGSCGVSYGGCGTGCDPCGFSSCGGCGIACAIGDCGTGISSSPAPQSSPPEPYSGPSSNPKTFADPDETGDGADGPFRQPAVPDSTGDGGAEVFPGGSGSRDSIQETNKPTGETIQQRKDAAPADAEPAAEDADNDPPVPPPSDPEVDVKPLRIDSPIAAGIIPARTRVRYAVRFQAPRIARIDVSPNTGWTPVDIDTKLAASQ